MIVRRRVVLKVIGVLVVSWVLSIMATKVKSSLSADPKPKKLATHRRSELNRVEVIQGFGPPIEGSFDESLGMSNDDVGANKSDNLDEEIVGGNMPKPKRFVLDPQNPIYRTDLGVEYPGELGKAVKMNKNDLNTEQRRAYDVGWKNNAFNEFVSNNISVHRTLPTVADGDCAKVEYPIDQLPPTSVIICFHNEAWSVLLRTVHSVLERSPTHLLKEIILVDDFSDRDYLKQPLVDYMAQFPRVKILRMEKREGLIRARLRGADKATGKVLTFLDSHCECVENWLPPLLDRIRRDPHTVVCPVIDVIDDTTFAYHYAKAFHTNVGGFDWSLQFNWHSIPQRERKNRTKDIDPVASPTMAGGLFSIDREYFYYLGTYDDGFDIWGGENLELSFKTWMCGGRLEIVPCSHVGHIFRKRSPYKWRSGVNVLRRNTVRLAEVWLDDYKKYYYQRINNKLGDYGNVSSRVALRKKLKCQSFKWYLDTIFPELFIPGNAIASGEVRNQGGGAKMCLDWGAMKKGKSKGSKVEVYWCHDQGGNQYWLLSTTGEMRRDDHCLDYPGGGKDVMMYSCHGQRGNQQWSYDPQQHQLFHNISGKCLEMGQDGAKLQMKSCSPVNQYQQWVFKEYTGNKAVTA